MAIITFSPCRANAAAIEAVRSETFFLKGFKELIDIDNPVPLLDFEDTHPLLRKMSSYEALTPKFLALFGRSLILMYADKSLENFFVLCLSLGTMVVIANHFPKGLKDFLRE